MHRRIFGRAGQWMPGNDAAALRWLQECLEVAEARAEPPLPPDDPRMQAVDALVQIVEDTPGLTYLANAMFLESLEIWKPDTPDLEPILSWPQFITYLREIMAISPMYYTTSPSSTDDADLVGFPINALLDYPMATKAGYAFWSNQLVNQKMRDVLNAWGRWLLSEGSNYVLNADFVQDTPRAIGWLSDGAMTNLNKAATTAQSADNRNWAQKYKSMPTQEQFTALFDVPDKTAPAMGFASWDDFFTRQFNDGVRPVGCATIVASCESGPLQYVQNVQRSDRFWAKNMPYSLTDMFAEGQFWNAAGVESRIGGAWAEYFSGGSVYQAFLSALSYHCWHAPVDGTVVDAYVVPGAYYLENPAFGFDAELDGNTPDPAAANDSQPFLSSVATRAVIVIEADDPNIGKMGFVAIGMSEVSSCEIQVVQGQPLQKGDPIGRFHFGGSTHCMVFRPGIALDFRITPAPTDKQNLSSSNVAVRSSLADVVVTG